jgi:hypothetical protein
MVRVSCFFLAVFRLGFDLCGATIRIMAVGQLKELAQPNYGAELKSEVRPSPDSSGSPQQRTAMAFCTVI